MYQITELTVLYFSKSFHYNFGEFVANIIADISVKFASASRFRGGAGIEFFCIIAKSSVRSVPGFNT